MPTTPRQSTPSPRPPRRATDDAQASSPRRRGGPRATPRRRAGLAIAAPVAPLGDRTRGRPPPRTEEPGDEPDLADAVGPLLAWPRRGHVPADRHRLRQRVLEAVLGRRAGPAVAESGRDRHRAQAGLTGPRRVLAYT